MSNWAYPVRCKITVRDATYYERKISIGQSSMEDGDTTSLTGQKRGVPYLTPAKYVTAANKFLAIVGKSVVEDGITYESKAGVTS